MRTCLLCPNPRIEARGLCAACYQKARRCGLLDRFPTRTLLNLDNAGYCKRYYWRTVERRRAVARACYHRRKAA